MAPSINIPQRGRKGASRVCGWPQEWSDMWIYKNVVNGRIKILFISKDKLKLSLSSSPSSLAPTPCSQLISHLSLQVSNPLTTINPSQSPHFPYLMMKSGVSPCIHLLFSHFHQAIEEYVVFGLPLKVAL
jgi:hypothetical protein